MLGARCFIPILLVLKTISLALLALVSVTVSPSFAETTQISARDSSKLSPPALATLPMSFEANRGQFDARVSYVSRGRGYTLFFTNEAEIMKLQRRTETGVTQTVVTTRFIGQTDGAALTAKEPLDSRVNYLTGDRAHWRTSIPEYGAVRRAGIYPGIDVVYYGKEGQLEYDLVVAPNADPHRVRMRIEGADSLALNKAGELVLHTLAGDVVQRKPIAYQLIGGRRRPVDAYFKLRNGEVSFGLGSYRRDRQLIIDPTLVFATYFGKSATTLADAAVDSTGHLIFTGYTADSSFPVKSGSYDTTYNNQGDAFVVKLTKAGDGRIFSTYFGGSGYDAGAAVTVGPSDSIYVAGGTSSTDFAHFIGTNRNVDVRQAFVAELNASGTSLVYATSFGGNSIDGFTGTSATAISVDRDGNAYIAGNTASTFLPVTSGAFQNSYQGGNDIEYSGDAFAAILNPSGSAFLMCTYLGSAAGPDYAYAVANDTSGNIYVGGSAGALFPTTVGTVQPTSPAVGLAGFVAKLNGSGGRLWATFLAARNSSWVSALAVDTSNNVYAAGSADSSFPTSSGAYRPFFNGGNTDAFVAKLSSTGSAFRYSTFLGGSGYGTSDAALALKVDSTGNAYVAGITTSTNFPTTLDGFQRTFGGGKSDAFLSVLNTAGSGLRYSTYYGRNGDDQGKSVALDSTNNIYIAGVTTSTNLPFKNGAQSTPGPMFMAKFSAIAALSSCSQPTTSPGIHVCAPPSGGSAKSPVTIAATLRWDGDSITGNKVYLDGNTVFSGLKDQIFITSSLPLATGGHRLTVRMWNSAGQSFSVSESFTVQ